ncbi:rhomboid family intramembrane serine protease [Rarobacter faecitabidus]|uniref:Membrane associated rhomboid family serine protease n=1 Tax=Rarobacter faecitabidus TaxID=13243 RepID=A0A542ZP71_RARFA|nr:rhomboid family intramembrane serine protease [Rarobacter faecitabidus]TQL62174.1 membrane associated rhomboid family serine protease [Rarobacter faecitabidus]
MTYPSAAQPGGPNMCYRHPDSPAFVRCQRCDRPICSQCVRNAPVGVQCVECAGGGSGKAGLGGARFGQRGRTSRASRFSPTTPVITYGIIALCVVSYLLQKVTGGAWTQDLIFAPFIGVEEPWRFLTAAFLHAGLLHIAFNMIALWSVGGFLEITLGRVRYVSLYLLSALGGSVGVLLLASPASWDWYTGVLGASGAVFGLFAAIVFELRRLGQNAQQMLVVIGLNLVFGFVWSGIAWQAHLGGLVIGAALGFVYSRLRRPDQRQLSYFATGAVGAALVIAAVAKYAVAGAM